ncbi:hypothetical protein PsorP6_000315 [Peronosclerospora sorghi]|uniref:Uncharacterized protein n=1 Tax=Peronosclerospora sorghi TaxID=230839 RepID=A0ACC0WXS2_9STRA|nr:hypothetical protein PsorP6_000315 [Peronosclerospora sorghi]
MDEDTQQRITSLLQEIDANIFAAHRAATQIYSTVRRHHQILRQIHECSQVWRPLFDSFTQQPVERRATRTPSRFSTPFTPVSTTYDSNARHRYDIEDDEDVEDTSFVSREETFKTTTQLKKHQPSASASRHTEEDSLSTSINSENLPRMSRTPYMSKSAVQSSAKTKESTSTFNSSDRGQWSPRMTSPSRTEIISVCSMKDELIMRDHAQTDDAKLRQISTPPSIISSVEHRSNSPCISRNLMKVGAFEYTPPRAKKSISSGEEKEMDQTADSIDTPYLPEFSTVRLSTSNEMQPNINYDNGSNSSWTSEYASERKRKRSDVDEKRRTPVYPKTHYPEKATSPFTSPSLRRKYSNRSNTSSPSHRRSIEGQTSATATPPRRRDETMLDDDTPRTPDFDMTSPLLRTQLKAMTPNTPFSNRLVGASFDVGSISQEARLQDYDDNAGEPTPKFELSLLPTTFQRGVGAVQVSTVYSKFQGTDDDTPAISVDQLVEMLPGYRKEAIEILLDMLVSRRLLRPFAVEGTMFWQKI